MAGKGDGYKPKFASECKFYDFSTDRGSHAMMAIPTKINEVTGMGVMNSYGVAKIKSFLKAKIKSFLNPTTLMAMRKFVADNPDEADRTIGDDDHVGKEWGDD